MSELFARVPFRLLDGADLNPYDIATYAGLLRFTHFNGETGARVSDGKLADLIGCSEREVRRARLRLRDLGWIEWTHQNGAVNRYRVRREPSTAAEETAVGEAGGAAYEAAVPRPTRPRNKRQKQETKNKKEIEQQVREVFDLCNRLRTERRAPKPTRSLALTEKRASHIRARLRQGYTVTQLSDAARGFYHDQSWPERDRFLDPIYIYRDDDKLQRFIDQRHELTNGGPDEAYRLGRAQLDAIYGKEEEES